MCLHDWVLCDKTSGLVICRLCLCRSHFTLHELKNVNANPPDALVRTLLDEPVEIVVKDGDGIRLADVQLDNPFEGIR